MGEMRTSSEPERLINSQFWSAICSWRALAWSANLLRASFWILRQSDGLARLGRAERRTKPLTA